MKKFLAIILALTMVLALSACGKKAEEKVSIVLATGGTSGTYYAVGGVIQTVLGPKLTKCTITAESTGASKANINMITDGEAQMAIVQSDVASYAFNGTESFNGTPEKNALWVCGIYNETVQIICRKGINSVSDLKGKTVVVGDVGSGTEINAWQVMGAVGIGKNDINAVNGGFQTGVDMLADGKVDAVFTVAGAPTTSVVDYATTHELNLVSMTEAEVNKVVSSYPLVRDDLPANTYTGQTQPVVCAAVQAAVVASKDLSEDVVYEFLKGMFDNKAELTAGHAKFGYLTVEGATANTCDMHPGAIKYYKEIGAIK